MGIITELLDIYFKGIRILDSVLENYQWKL
jgi:hypothetical protein